MMTCASSIRRAAGFGLAALLAMPRATSGQATSGTGFSPGARTIVDLTFAGTPVGDFPKGLRLLQGNLEVVDKDGVRMLRASSPSEFVLQLPEALPKSFTVEFEIIPKACCNPVDLMLEGVISGSRSPVSAQLEWHPGHFAVVGGNPQMFQMDMPAAIAATLPSTLTKVAVSFEDETVKMYTNGQRLYTLGARKFVRGRVLRISLGGQDDDLHAVYLARVRIADASSTIASASSASPSQGASPSSGPVISSGPVATAIANVTVTPGPNGPVVDWLGVPSAVYTVQRWLQSDLACCNNTSPASPPLTAPPWQDAPPPISGTYIYRVTATTSSGSTSAQTTFDYLNTGGGQILAPGGAPASGPRPLPSPTTMGSTTATAPTGANAGTVPSGFSVTVTMGASGPMVSWPVVPNATGYTVSRYKNDDLNCCNTSSGRTWGALSPWQDLPLPVSGTYVYQVIANTAAGQILAQTTFDYTQPAAPVTAVPAVTTATATPVPAPVTGAPAVMTGTATPMPAPTSSTLDPANPSNPSGGSGASATAGQFRVTLTGFRVAKETLELPTGLDGRGDEVYASAVAVLWDRASRSVRARSSSRTREHGDIGNGTLFSQRIQAGTMTPSGGIWTGNGLEQVPAAFDPSGSSTPTPTTDRFPLLVWEGTLNDGVDALLVVPTLWEKDADPSAYQFWLNNWTSSPLTAFLGSPQVQSQVVDPRLMWVIATAGPGLPLSMPLPDMTANIRDHPIGVFPQPPIGPVVAMYQDRHVMLTREKLAGLAPGSATLLTIPYSEPTSPFFSGLYWLYVRVERIR